MSEPTKEERDAADRAAKAREDEEQATLPYKWTQTVADLDITVPVPGNLRGKDLDVKIGRKSLKVGIKGQEAIIDVGPIPLPSILLVKHCAFTKAACRAWPRQPNHFF